MTTNSRFSCPVCFFLTLFLVVVVGSRDNFEQYTTIVDHILGHELYARFEELGQISEESGIGILSRPSFSHSQVIAATLIREWMIEAGMHVHIDAIGNIIGRYETAHFRADFANANVCEANIETLSIGSHYDSVRNAGKYDGTYGVLTGIAIIKILNAFQMGTIIPFAIEIVAFDVEESNNDYGMSFFGSKYYAGLLFQTKAEVSVFMQENAALVSAMLEHQNDIHSFIDGKNNNGNTNMTFAELRRILQFNIMTERNRNRRGRGRRDIFAFLEAHIEQGPVLEYNEHAIGVVTAINGRTGLHLDFHGIAGHAGTVPMYMRKDALVSCAQTAVYLNELALQYSEKWKLVITVGRMSAFPGSENVIPSKCEMTVDLRCLNNTQRLLFVHEILEELQSKYNMSLTHRADSDGILINNWLSQEILVTAAEQLFPDEIPFRLVSGALHDTQILSEICDVAMLFVRCRDGISHNPLEFITLYDSRAGAKVLYHSVLEIIQRKR